MDLDSLLMYLVITVTTVGLGWTIYFVFRTNPEETEDEMPKNATKSKDLKNNKKSVEKKGNKLKDRVTRKNSETEDDKTEDHRWFVSIFKGHTSPVTCVEWSPSGKYLASCAEDRTVLIWLMDFSTRNHKNVRVNVPYDSANRVSWSPDSKAFIISKEEEKMLEVYKLGKKPDGSLGNITSALKFKEAHSESIVGIGIACNGNFIMSCSSDGHMILWSIKGAELEHIRVEAEKICSAKVSACGRYATACGATPDVPVFEVKFNSAKNYQGFVENGKLKGHDSTVYDVAFNSDSSRIVTITKSGTWRLFDTTGQRVNLICHGVVENFQADDELGAVVAITPDGRVVAVGHGDEVDLFVPQIGSASPVSKSWKLPSSSVQTITFSSDSKYIVTGGDKNIRVYHNVCGYYAKAQDLTSQIKDLPASSAQKNRLETERQEVMKRLKEFDFK